MKIALVYYNLTAQGGGQRQFLSLARELKKMGEQVVVYAAEFDPRCYPAISEGLDVRIIQMPKKFSDVDYGSKVGLFTRLQKKWQAERLYQEMGPLSAVWMNTEFGLGERRVGIIC